MYDNLQVLFQSKENNKIKGQVGEEIARRYLVNKGFNIVATNWRTAHLEVDIIAEYEKYIVFVEVKLRYPGTALEPHMTVNRKKQKHLVKAANEYLLQNNEEREARFDIVSILVGTGEKPLIEHFEDAFYAGM